MKFVLLFNRNDFAVIVVLGDRKLQVRLYSEECRSVFQQCKLHFSHANYISAM
jgi:hypothetical protein